MAVDYFDYMKWKNPPVIKIYEAFGCLADGRIEIFDNEAKVYSSSRNKFYTITYDEEKNAIMANDNGSYWQGYLGYPSIAFLMKAGKIKINLVFAEALKDIAWKDVNTEFKNDFAKTQDFVDELLVTRGINLGQFHRHINEVLSGLQSLKLNMLGNKVKPPTGY